MKYDVCLSLRQVLALQNLPAESDLLNGWKSILRRSPRRYSVKKGLRVKLLFHQRERRKEEKVDPQELIHDFCNIHIYIYCETNPDCVCVCVGQAVGL